jgi:hypothetical protein
MKFYKTFSAAMVLVIALTIFGTTTAFAQKQDAAKTDDKILVSGDPSLKESDINVVINFYEWLFEAKFTAAERREFQTLLVSEAKTKPAALAAVAEIVAGFKNIETVGTEKSGQIRNEFLPQIVGAMRQSNSKINRLLLGIYENARGETSNDEKATISDERNVGNNGGAQKIADLAGLWSNGSVSSERYKSLISGELSAPSGTMIEYEISPNGQVKYAGYMSNTFYSCTVQMFIYKTGRVSVNGSNLMFNYAPGSRTNIPCAADKREATIPAESKTVPFRLERDEYGVKLCMTENGAEVCLRKVK